MALSEDNVVRATFLGSSACFFKLRDQDGAVAIL
jgi:hypothetical protein